MSQPTVVHIVFRIMLFLGVAIGLIGVPVCAEPHLQQADVCAQVLDYKSDTAETYYVHGLACFETENYDLAADDLAIAIRLDADYYPTILAHFTDVINTNPVNTEAYIIRGKIYLTRRELDSAMADFNQALTLDSECARAYWGRGAVYVIQANEEKAVAEFNRVLEIDPDYVPAYHLRSMAYGKMFRYELALADADRALELNPEDARNHLARAAIYFGRGYMQKNKGDCRKALSIAEYALTLASQPRDEEISYYYQGMAYLCLQDLDNALIAFDQFETVAGPLPPGIQELIDAQVASQ